MAAQKAQRARVLVVDDDNAIRDGLTVALRSQGYTVWSVADGSGVDQTVQAFRPDVAILDVRLPTGPSGFEIARSIRRSHDIPVIFLTAADSVEERLTGFDVGADDYLVKPFTLLELLARIRVTLRRTGRASSEVYEVGELLIDEKSHTARLGGEALCLRPKEWDVLVILARHRGRVLSKQQLLDHAWGFDAFDTNLVEVQVRTLRRKLGPHAWLLQTIRGAGYVLRS